MPKAGIYCRLSIEDRDKAGNDTSVSIQNQKDMLLGYCHEREWEIYDIYIDDGYSGIDRNIDTHFLSSNNNFANRFCGS